MSTFPKDMHLDPAACLQVGDVYVPLNSRYSDERFNVGIYLGLELEEHDFPISLVGTLVRDRDNEFGLGDFESALRPMYLRRPVESSKVHVLYTVPRDSIIDDRVIRQGQYNYNDGYSPYGGGSGGFETEPILHEDKASELALLAPLALTVLRRYNDRSSISLDLFSEEVVSRRKKSGRLSLNYWKVEVKNTRSNTKGKLVQRGGRFKVWKAKNVIDLDDFFGYP